MSAQNRLRLSLDLIGDAFGAAFSSVRLALTSEPAGAVLSGILSESAVAGIATFSDLLLEQGRKLYAEGCRQSAGVCGVGEFFGVVIKRR
jgi:hypothetical protein